MSIYSYTFYSIFDTLFSAFLSFTEYDANLFFLVLYFTTKCARSFCNIAEALLQKTRKSRNQVDSE